MRRKKTINETENTDAALSDEEGAMGTKDTKFPWPDKMTQDLFDINMTSELLKRALLLENMGAATAEYYETVSVALKLRIEQYKNQLVNPVYPSGPQCRNKLKTLRNKSGR